MALFWIVSEENFNYKEFGETIRSINGDLECNGKNASERDDRINLYKKFVGRRRSSSIGWPYSAGFWNGSSPAAR